MRFGLALTFVAILAFPSTALADDEHVPNILPPKDHGARTLRGHTFIEPALQETPFITSHIGVRQGVTYFSLPRFPISREYRADLRIFGLTERVDLQVRILPWLAIHAAGEATVSTGLDQPSLFYGQSTFVAGGRGGPVLRLFRSRASGTQLTLRGHFGGAAGNDLLLPGFVEAVAVRATREVAGPLPSTPEEASNRLLRAANSLSNAALADTTAINYSGSVHLAQTLIREIGIQTSFVAGQRLATDEHFDPILQRRKTTDTTDTTVRFAASASFDGYHFGVPVSLLGEYAIEKTYRSAEGESTYVPSAHLIGGGLFYSGRTDLQLGVSFFVRRNLVAQQATAVDGTRAETGIPTSLFGQFVIRYVWN